VRPSVRDSRGSFMFPRYLQYLLTDFRPTFVTGASRDRDELIRFWGQKVKVQGHGMTKCIQDFHVSTISPVSIDRFLPNFCHWCILGHRWPDYVFGSKGQSSRSHHRGGGAQHSTLPSSATFSSCLYDASVCCLPFHISTENSIIIQAGSQWVLAAFKLYWFICDYYIFCVILRK